MKTLLGKKAEMKQVFSSDGERLPATEIVAGPCSVVFERDLGKHGYQALGLSFSDKGVIAEVRIEEEAEKIPVGETLTVDKIFSPGDLVDIVGTSKGLGFTGVVKRYHFKGGPRTHGQSDRERAPGSIGQTTTPGRVYKGKRMAGKEGNRRKTIKNLLVLKVDGENHKILIKGAVPGKKNGLLIIKNTGLKAKGFNKEAVIT